MIYLWFRYRFAFRLYRKCKLTGIPVPVRRGFHTRQLVSFHYYMFSLYIKDLEKCMKDVDVENNIAVT